MFHFTYIVSALLLPWKKSWNYLYVIITIDLQQGIKYTACAIRKSLILWQVTKMHCSNKQMQEITASKRKNRRCFKLNPVHVACLVSSSTIKEKQRCRFMGHRGQAEGSQSVNDVLQGYYRGALMGQVERSQAGSFTAD